MIKTVMDRKSWVCVLVVVASAFCNPAIAHDKISFAKRLPKNVNLFLSIPNARQAVSRWRSTKIFDHLSATEMKPFVDDFFKNFHKSHKEYQKIDFFTKLMTFLPMAEGEVCVAYFKPPRSSLAICISVDYKDSLESKVHLLLTSLIDQIMEYNEVQIEKFDYKKTKVAALRSKGSQQDACYFFKEGRLVITSSEEAARSIVDRWDEKNVRSFGDSGEYLAMQKKLGIESSSRNPSFIYYFDPIRWLSSLSIEKTSTDESRARMRSILLTCNSLNLHKVHAVGGSIDFAKDGIEVLDKFAVIIDSKSEGLLTTLNGPVTQQWPANSIPDQAHCYYAWNWDIENAIARLDEVYQLLGQNNQIESILIKELGVSLSELRKSIDGCTGKFRYYAIHVDGSSDPPHIYGDLKFKSNSTARSFFDFATKVKRFRNVSQTNVKSQDLDRFHLSVIDRSLVLSSEIEQLKRLTDRGQLDNLASSKEFKALQNWIPEKTSFLGFSKINYSTIKNSIFQLWIEQLREGRIKLFGRGESLMVDDFDIIQVLRSVVPNLFQIALSETDFRKLPDDDFLKRLNFSVASHVVPDQTGFIVQTILVPISQE